MENDYLQALAQVVLPTEILDYFSITGIAQTTTEIHISLDERMNKALSNDAHFESKGFMEVANVTDFPIRDHKVILRIRRRRWTDLRTGKSFSIPIDLDIVAKGTRYSKEFGSFLKETYGDIPSDLPYAWGILSYRLSYIHKVEEAGMHSFNVIAATFYEHYDEILNFYNHRSSNAMAESFNAKIKLFRANLRGVADKRFFLFRIAKLYAYPH